MKQKSGRKKLSPHWIRHSHLFGSDEYECSECGSCFKTSSRSCPSCRARMTWTDDPQDWIDEAEELDMILGDD